MPKIKKEIYKFTEVGAMLFDMFPGHYLNLKSAIATVNTHARELSIYDINGKKSHRSMTARDAERVLASCEATLRQFTTTPIERAIRDADDTPQPAEAPVEAPVEHVIEAPKDYVEAVKAAVSAVNDKKTEVDAFEALRKKFYTDVNYFIKYAQTPQERLAIWETIGKLYGLTRLGG